MKDLIIIILTTLAIPILYLLIDIVTSWLIAVFPAEVTFGIMTALTGAVLYYFYRKEIK